MLKIKTLRSSVAITLRLGQIYEKMAVLNINEN